MSAQELYHISSDFHHKKAKNEYDYYLEECRQQALKGEYEKIFQNKLDPLVIEIFKGEGFQVKVMKYDFPGCSCRLKDPDDECPHKYKTFISWKQPNTVE